MVEGGMKCVKYFLFGFNLIFFLAGLGLIIAGGLVQTKFREYLDFFGTQFSAAAILVIVVGVVILIIGFFGCCGAYKENYCMTMTFAVLLGIIFILEIAAGITAYVMQNQLKSYVGTKMDEASSNYGISDGVTKTWDTMQHDFKCCGVYNYTIWENNDALKANSSLPDSCCKTVTSGCGYQMAKKPVAEVEKTIFAQGCIDGFVSWAESNIYTLGGVGIGLAFVQVFGVLLACCLARSIKKEYEVV